MRTEGKNFRYFLDNESTTYADILRNPASNFSATVDGFDIHYSTIKDKSDKTEKVLQQAEEKQKQNGGRLDLDSLIYAFELREQPVTEANKKFYDVCYSKISDKLQETLIDRHAKGDTVLPQEFSAVAADVNKNNSLQWEQMSKFNQIPFDVEEYLEGLTGYKLEEVIKGKKETDNKLDYELDWEFIQQMAERMSTNKGKYPPNNWKLPMDTDKLKQSLLRHTLEVVKGNDSDDGRIFGHYESVALNAMMICYQLRNKL